MEIRGLAWLHVAMLSAGRGLVNAVNAWATLRSGGRLRRAVLGCFDLTRIGGSVQNFGAVHVSAGHLLKRCDCVQGVWQSSTSGMDMDT